MVWGCMTPRTLTTRTALVRLGPPRRTLLLHHKQQRHTPRERYGALYRGGFVHNRYVRSNEPYFRAHDTRDGHHSPRFVHSDQLPSRRIVTKGSSVDAIKKRWALGCAALT